MRTFFRFSKYQLSTGLPKSIRDLKGLILSKYSIIIYNLLYTSSFSVKKLSYSKSDYKFF